MRIRLEGAAVAITGGARGIGRATAAIFAERGARVWIGDLDEDLVKTTAAELGDNVRGHRLDVTDRDSFGKFLDAAGGDGPLAVLVNNAGIWRVGDFLDQPLAGITREIEVNLCGTAIGMRLALPGMVERDRGHIVNISSMAGKMALPGGAVYSGSKFGVAALSRAVRAELPTKKVRITTVFPATVRTEFQTGLSLDGTGAMPPEKIAEQIVGALRHRRNEIAVPRLALALGAVEELLPERFFDTIKRKATAGIFGAVDEALRQNYYAARGD
jgi:short-subunit dehydrogenase